MGGVHKTVKPLYEAIRAGVSLWDSRKATQEMQPLIGTESQAIRQK